MAIVSIIFALFFLIALYFLIRLHWLKNFENIILLRSPHIIYPGLPSLNTMMWKKFWVWNNAVFLPEPEKLVEQH